MIVNEPQVWVLIGVFVAIMVGGFTITTSLMIHAMNSGFKAVDARFAAVDTRFDSVEATMNARFEAVNTKIDLLDRDVAAISRRTFGTTGE